MNKDEPVRLLILEESQNRAEEIIVLLRTAGHATRAHLIEDEADLTNKLNEQAWDLLLTRNEANGVTAEFTINTIQNLEKDVPVVLIADDRNPESLVEGMKLGALDVALADDDERLLLIAERELRNLEHRRARRRAEVELRETDRRNNLLLANSSAAIAYVHEGMHIYTNEAYAELFGYEDEDEFAGIPIIDLIAPDEQEKFKGFLKSYEQSGDEQQEFTIVTSDGSNLQANMSLSPATYDGENCTQVIFRAQTSDVELESRIKEISSQDLLTGLYNRNYFSEQLDNAVDHAADGKNAYTLFYILIDSFDRIRNEAGISNADLVLGDIASLLRSNVDDKHIMARFGDDVFTMLYCSGDKDEASALAEELREKVGSHVSEVSGRSYDLTISIGLTLITENASSSEEVISRGHQAVTSMEDGNGVNFYKPRQVTVGEEGRALSTDDVKDMVKAAIEENTVILAFQPVISLQGEDEEHFEVLSRIPDADGNELSPGQFFGPAEEAGLLDDLDRWIVQEAIKQLAAKRAEGNETRLFINITHKSMGDETFLPWFNTILKAAKLPNDAIIFQIHENDATSYIKDATSFGKACAAIKCKTSINHFGCSLNPLNLLKHVTPDYAKLDGSFAAQIEQSEEKQQELIEMVAALQEQGVQTAIAGVEEPNALATLWQAGIHYIQGYYVSPPLENMDYDFGDEAL
jgi:diguanylate cyclase (GGDEF)-like protein/PAS domain S-box-containing protein